VKHVDRHTQYNHISKTKNFVNIVSKINMGK